MSYRGKTVVAVIPARGGSKGIPDKNLIKIHGRSLTRLAVDCALSVPEIDTVKCSTDSARIAAEAVGAEIVVRPPVLAGDAVGDAEVLRHADSDHDIVVMLQPTSPLRKPDDVSACIRMLVNEGRDSVWTVSPTDLHYHPMKQLVVVDGGIDSWNGRGIVHIRRQELTPTYTRNGVCYAMTRQCLEQYGTMGLNCGALILEGEHRSIDTMEDVEWLTPRLQASAP